MASFGLPNQIRTHCGYHRQSDEILLAGNKCIQEDCMVRASYGIPGGPKLSCAKHHKNGEVNLVSKRCVAEGCNTQPNFGLPNQRPTCCTIHKLDGMIDVMHKRCMVCDMITANQKYKPWCARCYFYTHPDDPRITNYKTKEQAFMLPLKEVYSNMVLDKVISGGCSRRRPDGMIDCLTHVVIVEIDEDQHISYDQTCDNRRTMEIFRDVGNRPVSFVRLNPDGYTRDGKHIGKTFSTTKSGELKCNNKEFERRFEVLVEAVGVAINTIPDSEITVKQLFFTEK